jgi:hypothetical protein
MLIAFLSPLVDREPELKKLSKFLLIFQDKLIRQLDYFVLLNYENIVILF